MRFRQVRLLLINCTFFFFLESLLHPQNEYKINNLIFLKGVEPVHMKRLQKRLQKIKLFDAMKRINFNHRISRLEVFYNKCTLKNIRQIHRKTPVLE